LRDIGFSRKLKELAHKVLKCGNLYDADYFDKREGRAARSAIVIAESIVKDLNPTTVVDVGCGTGTILDALRQKGCQVFGLEYSEAALEYCRKKGLNILKFDLQKDSFSGNHFDVAISTEVAEHLPAAVADRYVSLLTSLSKIVIFTAAQPGQGGTNHVNEQSPSYWTTKFYNLGFQLDEALSHRWQEVWKASGIVVNWYYLNLMIFREKDSASLVGLEPEREAPTSVL
jgi:cyclopropane fatty-acyl-phospholipid synthase-like methyltransferase